MRDPTKYRPSPICPRCGISMRLSRLPPYFQGSAAQTYECDLCDAIVTKRPAHDQKRAELEVA